MMRVSELRSGKQAVRRSRQDEPEERGYGMTKKAWETPRVTVLVRGNPEEAVLNGCKSVGGTGPYTVNTICLQYTDCNPKSCQMLAKS